MLLIVNTWSKLDICYILECKTRSVLHNVIDYGLKKFLNLRNFVVELSFGQ